MTAKILKQKHAIIFSPEKRPPGSGSTGTSIHVSAHMLIASKNSLGHHDNHRSSQKTARVTEADEARLTLYPLFKMILKCLSFFRIFNSSISFDFRKQLSIFDPTVLQACSLSVPFPHKQRECVRERVREREREREREMEKESEMKRDRDREGGPINWPTQTHQQKSAKIPLNGTAAHPHEQDKKTALKRERERKEETDFHSPLYLATQPDKTYTHGDQTHKSRK